MASRPAVVLTPVFITWTKRSSRQVSSALISWCNLIRRTETIPLKGLKGYRVAPTMCPEQELDYLRMVLSSMFSIASSSSVTTSGTVKIRSSWLMVALSWFRLSDRARALAVWFLSSLQAA